MMDFKGIPLIGIIRGIHQQDLMPVMYAGIAAGLTCVEITMNTPDASALIHQAVKQFGKKLAIGAGTVTHALSAKSAMDAGATFIVAPNFDEEVAAICKQRQTPYLPGALTPTEIFQAWQAGCSMVKVFPVSAMGGVSYLRDLRGPFADIPLLACGGVTVDNLRDYFHVGVNAIGIGSQIFNLEWQRSGDYDRIQRAAQAFVQAVASPQNQEEGRSSCRS